MCWPFLPSLIWCDSRGLRQKTFFIFPHPLLFWCSYSLLCFASMKLFTCFLPPAPTEKKRFGIRSWHFSWGGKTWPFSTHGSTVQDDGDQELNVGAVLCTHFAWSGPARLERPWLTGRGVSTRKPGATPVLRSWPLYSIYFALLHVLTHFLITWSCGNRPVIQAIFVLIASVFPRHLAYVQKEDIRAFMGVKFYNESLISKTDHVLMGGMRKLLWPWVVLCH